MTTEHKIGIICALDEELKELLNVLENRQTQAIGCVDFYDGTIANKKVVLAKCGVGKVSSAICAQAMIDHFRPAFIINSGSAGALDPNLTIGNMVIADNTVEWDIDTTPFHPYGYIDTLHTCMIKPDPAISQKLADVINKSEKISQGLIVSGDQFITRDEQRKEITFRFPKALCAEMEGASIGHTCSQNNVPFVVFRCLSDSANNNSNVDFATFLKMTGEKTCKYLIEFIKNYNE